MTKRKKLPSGITQRGESYRVSIMQNGQRTTRTAHKLEEAVAIAEQIRAGLIGGPEEQGRLLTLEETAQAWYKDHVEVHGTSKAGLKTRKSQVKSLIEVVGPDRMINAIGLEDFTKLKTTLRVDRGHGAGHTNAHISCLRQILQHAITLGARSAPVPETTWVKDKNNHRIRFLSREEEARILSYLTHIGDLPSHRLTKTLIDTGVRVGEALALIWRDVGPDRIHVWKSKSRSPRAVLLTAAAKEAIHPDGVSGPPDGRVFAGLKYEKYRQRFIAAREHSGLGSDVTIHTLRHTCCTRLVSGGVDLRTVQTWMGHEQIEQTMRYAQFVPERLSQAVGVLEELT